MHLELGPSETELPASLRGVSRPVGRSSSEPVGDPNGACFGACGSALAVTMRVSRETLDAQQALGRGASSCRPPASAWPSAPCGWGFRPQPHRPGPPLATAQLPSGYLRPLPALRLSRVTELPYSGVLRSCLRVTCAPLGVGTRALRPAGL